MNARIIVVEDEPGISLPVKDGLEAEGFEVEVIEDGATAFDSILREQPDLVVLDLMLPRMNGLDLCRELRRRGFEAPIIMVTARAQEIDRVVGLEIGADDYVIKPFSLRELVARIRARLRRRPLGRLDEPIAPSDNAVSHYRLLERIGGGGMGVVYKARDLRLGRCVALKFLSPRLAQDPRSRRRFIQEARAASALDHPNIAAVYEIDEASDGQLFIAMAFYDGETLRQKLDRGPVPLAAALDVATQAAEGLASAHACGIVHCDVKPSNLMVTGEGIVKVVDFGVAKLVDAADSTASRTIAGTPGYLSPERARGHVADQRADVWSLGVVLLEAMTGRHPFGRSFDARSGLPAEWRLKTGEVLHPALERIARKALAQEPERRYRDAGEMLLDLRAFPTQLQPMRQASQMH